MNPSRIRLARPCAIAALLAVCGAASAQTFSSGSTGADGAFLASCAPTPCTVTPAVPANGVYNYTTYAVPAGVTVRYNRNAANSPITILATGNVEIDGTVDVSGGAGLPGQATGTVSIAGGAGGPGGFNGGFGGVRSGPRPSRGFGPGGGTVDNAQGNPTSGAYGAPPGFVTLIPLFGGSGGGGGTDNSSVALGPSGGGGGGAILIGSSTLIRVSGSVNANGGNFAGGSTSGGSGGAIRMVAPLITGSGSIVANGGVAGGAAGVNPGRIRLEAFDLGFTGSASPTPSQSTVVGPLTPVSTPALANLPTLAIVSVAAVAAPASPGGSFAAADVSLNAGTVNPVSVVVAATNTPISSDTSIQVRVMRRSSHEVGDSVLFGSSLQGSFASSTATFSVTLPAGEIALLQAWATMTLTGQVASLFPLIDGEPVEQVAMATVDGRSSQLTLISRSGKERRVDELSAAEQLQVTQAWQVMRTMQ